MNRISDRGEQIDACVTFELVLATEFNKRQSVDKLRGDIDTAVLGTVIDKTRHTFEAKLLKHVQFTPRSPCLDRMAQGMAEDFQCQRPIRSLAESQEDITASTAPQTTNEDVTANWGHTADAGVDDLFGLGDRSEGTAGRRCRQRRTPIRIELTWTRHDVKAAGKKLPSARSTQRRARRRFRQPFDRRYCSKSFDSLRC